MRQSLFSLGKYTDLHLDQHNFGSMHVVVDFEAELLETQFSTSIMKLKKLLPNKNGNVVTCTKYDFPGFDGNLLLQLSVREWKR